MVLLIINPYCNTHPTIQICYTVMLSSKSALFRSSQVQRPTERNCNSHNRNSEHTIFLMANKSEILETAAVGKVK
jgi:hypothetical protein